MKLQFSFLIFAIVIIGQISCNCGCLKCSKHLKVVSAPGAPCKVILRGPTCSSLQAPLPYVIQEPVIATHPQVFQDYNYRIETIPEHLKVIEPIRIYSVDVQTPAVKKSNPVTITGLYARPDRIVLPAPECPEDVKIYHHSPRVSYPEHTKIYHHNPSVCYGPSYSHAVYSRPQTPIKIVETPRSGPIFEKLPEGIYFDDECGCRYGHRHKRRAKRDLPILKSSVQFIIGLLPSFIKFPIMQTLKAFRYHQNIANRQAVRRQMLTQKARYQPLLSDKKQFAHFQKKDKFIPTKNLQLKPTVTFLEKLQKLNHENKNRHKRSLIFDDNEISLPFLRVTEVENDVASSEEEEEDLNSEERKTEYSRDEFLKPFNFDHIVPHSPIFYFLNTPIRLLHHIHQLGQQITPVFKSVPQVFINSHKYLRHFRRDLKNNVLNFASNLIGDFDEFKTPHYRYIKPKRLRRSVNSTRKLEPFEPEYSVVFGKEDKQIGRKKRYILKVVDEDEVEEFLRDKLGGLISEEPNLKTKRKSKDNKNKKKLVVEKLSSKLIIDNNGRPFVEINGVKRPLFLNQKKNNAKEDEQKEETESPPRVEKTNAPENKAEENESAEEDVKDKINSLILKARQRIDKNNDPLLLQQNEVPTHIIRDRINQILAEIQELINIDFDKYSTVHSNLCKLQSFKELLVNDWKKILIEEKSNDMSSKIRILDDFKEMQVLKEKSVENIAIILSSDNSFMTKKLIKTLVRLQKLQCIINRVVEDFSETIRMGTEFDARKEIKYIDYLSELDFVLGQSKHDLEKDLRNERDLVLENEMLVLEGLRKMLENSRNSPHQFYEESKLLWEIKNINKLQQDAIAEMNDKISRGMKVRKELKILFDLLKQLESCEEKQKKILSELVKKNKDKQVEQEDEVKLSAKRKRKHHIFRHLLHKRTEDKKCVKLRHTPY